MKKLFALSSISSLALLVAAVPAMAAQVDVSGENETTGQNSENENVFNVDNSGSEDVENTANVNNSGSVDAHTGNNEQSQNTEAGDLETGEVRGEADWETVVNAAAGMAGMDNEFDVDADFRNDTTGQNSDNENRLDVDSNDSLSLTNVATVRNFLGLDARTGGNEQDRNTTAGDLTTGDVEVDAEVGTWANNGTSATGSAATSTSVDVDAVNHRTGQNSENENVVRVDNSASSQVSNTSTTRNTINVDARTGNNTQSRNTTGGDIQTGNVEVSADIQTRSNSGSSNTGASNNVEVNADLSNDTTGQNSDNENRVIVNNNSSSTVQNEATVNNTADVEARTGGNEQNQNTTGGDVTTGDVEFNFNFTTEAN